MFILGNFLIAIGDVLDIALTIYMWIIIISALISWVNPDPYNPVVRTIYGLTEPVLRPVRRLLGFRLGPVDISPVIIILAIYFTKKFLIASIVELGYRLK